MPNPDDPVPVSQCANRDRADRWIETGDVAAAGQDRDCAFAHGGKKIRKLGPASTPPTFGYALLVPGMVFALGVPFELRSIEIDVPEIARRVADGLVIEVRRTGMTTLPTRGHRFRPHAVAELHDRDEAVAVGPIPLLRSRIGAGAECGQRSPARRRERYRQAPPRA